MNIKKWADFSAACRINILFCIFLLPGSFTMSVVYAIENTDLQQPVLYDTVDTELQLALESVVNANPSWKKLIGQKRMTVGVVDLSNDEVRFASVNGDVMMYAASMPKIAILLAAYASFEDGSLVESDEIHRDLTAMIRKSSNKAATRIIDLVGFDKIAEVLSNPVYGLYDENKGGGLWVGKRYAQAGARRGDPLFNISHGATATQTCRFYYLLATERLISPYRSRQMLQDLSKPGIHHKFVNALDKLAPDAKVFRKSGTWKRWHADSIMVRGNKWRNYILVALVESSEGEGIMRTLLPTVEKILH